MCDWLQIETHLKLSDLEDIDPWYPIHTWGVFQTNPYNKRDFSKVSVKIGRWLRDQTRNRIMEKLNAQR